MEDKYYIRLTKVTSVVIGAHQRAANYTGTVNELERKYKQAQRYNLIAGWWSIPGLIWTPLALYHNKDSLKKLRQAANQ